MRHQAPRDMGALVTAGMVMGVGRKRGMSATLPAPTLGWNTKDPISEMKSGYAVTLDNYFPDSSKVSLRRGYREQASALGGAVKSVMEWSGPSSEKLFGFANSKIWDCSTFGAAATDVTAGSAITTDIWQGINFGGRATMFNGADVPRQYDGSNWADTGFTGATQENLITAFTYRSRIYAIEKNTLKCWYAGADAITGSMTGFDMKYVYQLGGSLLFGATLSRDSGSGSDDVACFVSDQGEILVYEGANPGDSSWNLIGRYRTAVPLSRRGFVSIGGDLALLTKAGLIPMSKIVAEGRSREVDIALTANISPTINQASRDYGSNFGWQPLLYPRGTMGMINVPIVDSSQSHQYVWNTLTGAWCRFKGVNALCWTLFNDKPYFGASDGSVYEFDVTNGDDGTAIMGDIRPAFSYLGHRGMRKQFHLAKPLVVADAATTFSVDLEVDYQDSNASNLVSLSGVSGTDWDDGTWDETDWAGGSTLFAATYGVTGLGNAASLRIRSQTQNVQIALNAMELYFTPAGWLG